MKKTKVSVKKIKVNPWSVSTIVLALVLAAMLYNSGFFCNFSSSEFFCKSNTLNQDIVGKKIVDFINNNLVQGTDRATLLAVEETNGLYKVTTLYRGQQIPVYCTKDGEYLFVSQPIRLSEATEDDTHSSGFDAPDKEIPDVELYVMSFCPYGVQAENAMKPVFDLLGNKANFKIRFIVNVNGDTPESVQSLHGLNEAMEDLRQICIMKYYDAETYWNYLMEINKNCYSIYRNTAELDKCWKAAAGKFKIDVDKIDTCSKSSEAINLLKTDEQLTERYGVRGSPTLIINGQTYEGSRTADAFKQAICSGFSNPPSECSSDVEEASSSNAPAGSC